MEIASDHSRIERRKGNADATRDRQALVAGVNRVELDASGRWKQCTGVPATTRSAGAAGDSSPVERPSGGGDLVRQFS
jgi:hypothetical protein